MPNYDAQYWKDLQKKLAEEFDTVMGELLSGIDTTDEIKERFFTDFEISYSRHQSKNPSQTSIDSQLQASSISISSASIVVDETHRVNGFTHLLNSLAEKEPLKDDRFYILFFHKITVMLESHRDLVTGVVGSIINLAINENTKKIFFQLMLTHPNLLDSNYFSTTNVKIIQPIFTLVNACFLEGKISAKSFQNCLSSLLQRKSDQTESHQMLASILKNLEGKFSSLSEQAKRNVIEKIIPSSLPKGFDDFPEKEQEAIIESLPSCSLFLIDCFEKALSNENPLEIFISEDIPIRDSLFSKLSIATLNYFKRIYFEKLDAAGSRNGNDSAICKWEKIKQLISVITKHFAYKKISSSCFITCLRQLDPYIQNIADRDRSQSQEIKERVRYILWILQKNLIWRPRIPRPSHPQKDQTKKVSLEEMADYQEMLAAWEAATEKRTQINQKTIALFSSESIGSHHSDREQFFTLLVTYTNAIGPYEPTSVEHTSAEEEEKKLFLFDGILIKESFLQILYLESDFFRARLPAEYDENTPTTPTIANMLSKINSVMTFEIPELPIVSPTYKELSLRLFNILSRDKVSTFKEFFNCFEDFYMIENNSSDVEAFFFIIGFYLAEQDTKSMLEAAGTLETTLHILEKNKQIAFNNSQRTRVYQQIVDDTDLCKRLAALANSARLLSPQPHSHSPQASERTKGESTPPSIVGDTTQSSMNIKFFLKLYNESEPFREEIGKSSEGTLGYKILQEILKQTTFRSSRISNHSADSKTNSSSNLSRSSDSPESPVGPFIENIENLSLEQLIKAYQRIGAYDRIKALVEDTLSKNIPMRNIDIFSEILGSISHMPATEPDKTFELLMIINDSLSRNIPKSDPTKSKTKKSSSFSLSLSSMMFHKKKSEKKTLADENKERKEVLDLLLQDDKISSQIAELLIRHPGFSISAEEGTLKIGEKTLEDTIFQKFYTPDSEFTKIIETQIHASAIKTSELFV